MSKNAPFKYTFPITKAEQRADGFYLTGYASGPEVDSEGERMTPDAIERFSKQINGTSDGERLVYRDAHAKDGVLRDLGEITKAWVNEHFHLGIEVKLDESNPASMYLFRSIKDKGKQYGMSVAGYVHDYADEFVEEVGKVVRTYKDVVLDEISNTTRPAWYPSFGTVLAKSVKDVSETVEEDMSHTAEAELDTTVEDTTKSDETAEAVETTKADDTEGAAAEETAADETAKADETVAEETTEKAGRKVSGATASELLGAFNTIQTALQNIGVIEAPASTAIESEKSASGAEEETTEKTANDASTDAVITKADLDVLASALEKANARIAELEARPATPVPGVITDTKKAEDELAEVLAKASPSERMRLAFAAHTRGK